MMTNITMTGTAYFYRCSFKLEHASGWKWQPYTGQAITTCIVMRFRNGSFACACWWFSICSGSTFTYVESATCIFQWWRRRANCVNGVAGVLDPGYGCRASDFSIAIGSSPPLTPDANGVATLLRMSRLRLITAPTISTHPAHLHGRYDTESSFDYYFQTSLTSCYVRCVEHYGSWDG